MSIKIYQNNELKTLAGNIELATETSAGLMSASDKNIMDDFFSSQFEFTSLMADDAWTNSSGMTNSGTLSKAYTNFDFLVVVFRGVDASLEIQTTMIPTSMITQGWTIYGIGFTLSGYTRQVGIKFSSTTAWSKVNRDSTEGLYGVSRIIGVKRRT
jgi:hypothetical protein